jgi:hypothetical protein
MKNKLLIVTDLGSLKAYRLDATPKGTPRLELLEEVVLEAAHHRLVEQVTDLAGRHVGPTRKSWGAPIADDHNLKLETKRRLIKQIAGHIKRLVEASRDSGCWLAAHKEINHLILNELTPAARKRIEKILARDLVKAGQLELLECFAPQLLTKKPTARRRGKAPQASRESFSATR